MRYTITVPGRTELAGNHTDHQGGRVLDAAVDLYLRAQAEETKDGTVTLASQGFGTVSISLDELSPEYSKPGSAEALARGTLEYLKKEGYALGSLRAELVSDIPVGAGLSSSAAFVVMVGKLQSVLYNAGEIPPSPWPWPPSTGKRPIF